MFIGTKIQEIRKFRKISRQELAKKLDISITALRKIEEDDTDINFSRLQQIADVFDMNVAELVGYGEKIVQRDNKNGDNSQNCYNIYVSDKDLAHKLDKSEQENQFLKEKISLLETTITDLRNTVAVLQEQKK
jgi:transcriptional regulator with XRE-family HTH domain